MAPVTHSPSRRAYSSPAGERGGLPPILPRTLYADWPCRSPPAQREKGSSDQVIERHAGAFRQRWRVRSTK
eukprot:scaffold4116_cov106-Isochrysis_galbana.AAC.1